MKMWRISILLLLMFACNANAQLHKRVFTSPLNIPIRLSGSFCEIRNDHFHSGIDIKTNGREGLPVFSVGDGYVYRIKVSAVGYGKAIYIMHPGNVVSVYGHLSQLTGAFADTIEAMQYRNKSFEVEYFPDSMLFPVKKGEQIALSGNSGGSEGPHLHFEIRDQLREEPLNPLLYDWFVVDTIPPVINSVQMYYSIDGDFISTGNTVSDGDTLITDVDNVAFAFEASDRMNDGMPSNLGIYGAVLLQDKDTVYQFANDRMNFDQTRFVNAHIDYSKKSSTGRKYQRLFNLQGNKSEQFKFSGSGVANVIGETPVPFSLIVSDVNGNSTKTHFYVKNSGRPLKKIVVPSISYPSPFIFKKWKDAEVEISENSFYEAVWNLDIEKEKKISGFPAVTVGPRDLIFRTPFRLRFIFNREKEEEGKHVIVSLNKDGEVIAALKSINKGRMTTATSHRPGLFSVAVDTLPPVIDSLHFETDSITNRSFFVINIKDNLSGIESYTCKVDDAWFLFEYDPKTNRLIADVKKLPGTFSIEIEVDDRCGNVSVKRAKITKPLF